MEINGIKLTPFDAAEYLDDDESRAIYLAEALEADSPEYFAHALDVVARSRGVADLSAKTGITRPGIYKAISPEGNPAFSTLRKLLDALNLEFTVKVKEHHA
jgi:probable addiction module antidote protein